MIGEAVERLNNTIETCHPLTGRQRKTARLPLSITLRSLLSEIDVSETCRAFTGVLPRQIEPLRSMTRIRASPIGCATCSSPSLAMKMSEGVKRTQSSLPWER